MGLCPHLFFWKYFWWKYFFQKYFYWKYFFSEIFLVKIFLALLYLLPFPLPPFFHSVTQFTKVFPSITKVLPLVTKFLHLITMVFPSVTMVFSSVTMVSSLLLSPLLWNDNQQTYSKFEVEGGDKRTNELTDRTHTRIVSFIVLDKGRAAMRHNANQPARPLWPSFNLHFKL